MTIEVRQLLIRSQVGVRAASPQPGAAPSARELELLKQQVLAECKAWVRQQMQATHQR